MQAGELIVTTANEVRIALTGLPIRINVDFSDTGNIIAPCDPHYSDKLEWEIHQDILTIRWEVSGIREIKWSVWFYWTEL